MNQLERARTVAEYVANFQRRILQDALAEATAAYWLRRAADTEAARARPGDYVPAHVTREERQARWDRLTALAQAYRNRATFALIPDTPRRRQDDEDIDAVMNELADRWYAQHDSTGAAA